MVRSLRYTIHKNFGNIDYLHYFRRMVRDYESGKWDFDVRTVVKNLKAKIPCPRYISKKGYLKKYCLAIVNNDKFIQEFERYFNCYIRPAQELRKNIILARRIFVKKYGYFTKYNQDCSAAGYNCKSCKSKYECDLSRKLSNKDAHIYKLTRLAELLYNNLNHGYWADLVKE